MYFIIRQNSRSLKEAFDFLTHSFAALTRSFSDTTQFVNKNRTRAFAWSNLYVFTTTVTSDLWLDIGGYRAVGKFSHCDFGHREEFEGDYH